MNVLEVFMEGAPIHLGVLDNNESNQNNFHGEGGSITQNESIRRFFEEDRQETFDNLNCDVDYQFESWYMNFSVYQSNAQFLIFFIASVLCLSADIYIQHLRGSSNTNTTYVTLIFITNILLWLDFILESQSQKIRNSLSGIITCNFPVF